MIKNNNNLLENLEKARLKYKPEKVKVLIIAEAPPDALDRFFYYENVKSADYLFLGISEALYPDAKKKYMEYGRHSDIKKVILEQFKEDGFYLLDLFELPVGLNMDSERQALYKLISKMKNLCSNDTFVILIKSSVYDIAYSALKSGFKVINKRIEFPSSGQQLNFRKHFAEAMKSLKF